MSEEQISQEQAPKSRRGGSGSRRPRALPGDGPINPQAGKEPDIEALVEARASQIAAERLEADVDVVPSATLQDTRAAAGIGKKATAAPAVQETGKPSLSIAEAMKKVKLANAQRIREEARINSDPELRTLKRQGINVLPPTGARARVRRTDPTVITDGDGKPIGKPGYKVRAVPRISLMGENGPHAKNGEINLHKSEGWEFVRYEHDDPDGAFKAGDIVEDHFGVRMQKSPDAYAEYWASKHPADGMDAQSYHDAQVQDIMERHRGSVVIQSRGRDLPQSGVREHRVSMPVGE